MKKFYGFKREVSTRNRKCSECYKKLPEGTEILASRSPKSRALLKAVCSEDCRLEFEAHLFEMLAEDREKRKSWCPG